MAPVLAQAVRMTELLSGEITLMELALVNDALMVRAENQRRARES